MRAVRSLLVALVVTAALVAAGLLLTGPDEREPAPPAAVPSLELADLDTTRLAGERASFCARITEQAITEALGADPVASTAYGNGERARITAETKDVAHEFACSWRAADGTLARAWVFAPPVTRARATELVEAASRRRGCATTPRAPPYGVPSLALTCTTPGPDGGREQSYRGLFGDAWLVCDLTAPRSATGSGADGPAADGPAADGPAADGSGAGFDERASTWCAHVALAAESA